MTKRRARISVSSALTRAAVDELGLAALNDLDAQRLEALDRVVEATAVSMTCVRLVVNLAEIDPGLVSGDAEGVRPSRSACGAARRRRPAPWRECTRY